MKLQHCFLFICTAWLASSVWAESGKPLIYINENLGFNVKGYNYNQSEYPCDIDKVLVKEIVERGGKSNLRIEPTSSADKLHSGKAPVLAIDVESLALGDEEFTFGTRSDSKMPSVGVTAALIADHLPEGLNSDKHHCSIVNSNDLVPNSSVLDMGTYGYTVCDAVQKKCLNHLSQDIVDWILPQLEE